MKDFISHNEESELHQAKKEAEAASFFKNQLVSILANEIQAPLESLNLFLQLIQKTQTISDQATCLDNIRLSSQLLENLINGLISADQETQSVHEAISFDFYKTVEDAVIPLIVSAKRKNITIDLSIQSQMPQYVVGDPNRLKQIVSYLILNAFKLIESGKITIAITPEDASKTVFKTYFTIKTSGISSLERDINEVFSSHNSKQNGDLANRNLNFGLELSKSLIKTMNGNLKVAQNTEDGFVFSFHVLLLNDQTQLQKQMSPKESNLLQRSLPMYNKTIRLKAEELQAIEQIRKNQLPTNSTITEEKKPSLLIVDDSSENTDVLARALYDNYEIQVANSGKDALTLVQKTPPPDMILLDLSMPEMNGFEVSKKIRLEELTKDIPIIFLTTMSDDENENFDLKSGAVDYITKPFDLTVVKEKIKNQLALKHYQDILNIAADVDVLTQIPSGRRFNEMLDIEIRKAKRMDTPLSVIFIDIDYFKNYNDIYGNLEGDECLREVAFALKKTLKRAGDLVARWSGEEFVCLLPDTNLKGAAHVAENLRKSVLNQRIPHQSSPVEKIVTLSLGVASGTKTQADSLEGLLDDAKAALLNAKQSGRNKISTYKK